MVVFEESFTDELILALRLHRRQLGKLLCLTMDPETSTVQALLFLEIPMP